MNKSNRKINDIILILIVDIQGINQYEMLNEGMNFNAKEIPSNFRSQFIHPQYNYQQPSNINNMNGSSYGGFSSFSSSSNNPYYHPHHYTYNNNSSNFNMNPNANLLPPPGAVMNDYTLLDIPSRRADRELGIGSSSRRKVGMRRQRGGGFIDPFKRCTNYNCNTNDTPMWRRGPLGPKVRIRMSLNQVSLVMFRKVMYLMGLCPYIS